MISKIGVILVGIGLVILFVEAVLALNNIWFTFLLISVVCLVGGAALTSVEEDNENAEKEEKEKE